MHTEISVDYRDSVGHITLRPPEGKPPTLDPELMDAFHAVLEEVESRASNLTAVVLQSASPKFFCAGANLKVMESIDHESVVPWVHRGHRLMNRLEALPLPVIARVEGYALGGGLELAMACDLIFASGNARFGQSEAKLGLVTGWGGCYRLVRRVGLTRAKELCFTGRMFDGEEAMRLGVVAWHGPADRLEPHLTKFIAAVAANSRAAVKEMKSILSTCETTSLEENAAIEAKASQRCLRDGDAAKRLKMFFAARRST